MKSLNIKNVTAKSLRKKIQKCERQTDKLLAKMTGLDAATDIKKNKMIQRLQASLAILSMNISGTAVMAEKLQSSRL